MPRAVDGRAPSLPGLDGIRAIAVAAVVAFHVGVPWLLHGWAAYRSGSLHLSWGLHFDNFLFNLLVVGASDDIVRSVAPLQFPGPDLLVTTVIIVVQCALTLAVLLPLIRRREAGVALPVSEVAHGHA